MKTTLCKKFLCLIFAFLILALSVVTLLGGVRTAYAEGEDADVYRTFWSPQGTRPSFDSLINAEALAKIDSALEEGADVDLLKQAAITLYDIANESRMGAYGTSLMLQESFMGIKSLGGSLSANMDFKDAMAIVKMRGFTLKDGEEWYNQFAAALQSDGGMGSLMQMLGVSTMIKINYHLASEPDKYYFNLMDKPSEAKTYAINCDRDEFPYQTFSVTQEATAYDLDGFKNAINILNAPNEIYNMEFMPQILGDDVTIEHKDGLYKVHFSVDPNADKELLDRWARMPKKDMEAGGQTLNSYLKYICDLEVWDNGYAKSYYAEYVRDAGFGSGITVDKFNYIWNEKEVFDIISDDFRLDDIDSISKYQLRTAGDYINYYITTEIVKSTLPPLYIALIVIGALVVAAIVAVIVVEILVKMGKLPKLAAKREAKKQKRLSKKTAKKGNAAETSGEEAAEASAEPEDIDGGLVEVMPSDADKDAE